MKVNQLKKLVYWIGERHDIYLRRKEGQPPPWTTDPILLKYRFTNVFRRLDRVTEYCVAFVVNRYTTPADLIFYCALFRLFNWPPTWEALEPVNIHWDPTKAKEILKAKRGRGEQVFTNAYMVYADQHHKIKSDQYIEVANNIYEGRRSLAAAAKANSLQLMCELLSEYHSIGDFVAYEIGCDLTYTPLLEKAYDLNTWSNAGPGAIRGLNRIWGDPIKQKIEQEEARSRMRALRYILNQRKGKGSFPLRRVPKLQLRDVEHSLCEFDKYERTRLEQGRPRRKFYPSEKPL